MSVLTGALSAGTLTGNHPGAVLTFHTTRADGTLDTPPAVVHHTDAHEVEVSVPVTADLRGGNVSVTLVGLSDDHHATLAAKLPTGGYRLDALRVHLFWRDTNSSVAGYLGNLLGLGALTGKLAGLAGAAGDPLEAVRVAEIAVTGVTRRRGARRYETVVTGGLRVAARTATRLPRPLAVTGLDTAAEDLARAAGIAVTTYPVDAADAPFRAARGERVADALQRLSALFELASGRYGRGMLLVRGDRLHLGPRPIPLQGSTVRLDWASGLLGAEALPPLVTDVEAEAEDGGTGAVSRGQWKLTLRGRPDLHPGDVVSFDPPVGEETSPTGVLAALAGAFAAPFSGLLATQGGTRGYVSGLTHTLSRTSGLLTELTVVALTGGEDGWDHRSVAPSAQAVRGATGAPADHPDPVVALRAELERTVAGRLAQTEVAEVGEVRGVTGRRTTVWLGTDPAADAHGNGTARLPIDRAAPLEVGDLPYLTPFAWGPCGLVLPRYPGTRVVAVHRHGLPSEPVDVGAVWPDGEGPDARPGDWWLTLPVGVPAERRTSLAPTAVPEPHRGTVTNDLVDADGHRVIEVGDLRIRIGPDAPGTAGKRPEPLTGDPVLAIEHSDGTTLLTFAKNGDVTLVAKGKLTLKGTSIALEGDDVDVTVKNRMNVEGPS